MAKMMAYDMREETNRPIMCNLCGKIAEENVKRITFSHQFILPFSTGHWMPEMMIDVCEDCGKKVLEIIDSLKQKKQEELHADR